MITIVASILGVVCVVLAYVVYNLNRKVGYLEQQQEQLEQKSVELVEQLIVNFFAAQQQLERVDKRGSFASDDEVGFVFTVIKNTVHELAQYLKKLQEQLYGKEEEQ